MPPLLPVFAPDSKRRESRRPSTVLLLPVLEKPKDFFAEKAVAKLSDSPDTEILMKPPLEMISSESIMKGVGYCVPVVAENSPPGTPDFMTTMLRDTIKLPSTSFSAHWAVVSGMRTRCMRTTPTPTAVSSWRKLNLVRSRQRKLKLKRK